MFSKSRGNVTVFICIILAAIIPFSCIMIDLARISWAKSQAKAASKICTESMLAAYDSQLKEQYGLFSLYPQGIDAMEKEIYDLMNQNLNVNASIDGVTDLYKFKIKSVQAIPLYNYSEPFVLQEQVAEFMKYRAPIAAVDEVYERLKVIGGLIKEGDMLEQKISVDKLMNDVRSNLVNISCMVNGVITEFNPLQSQNTTFKESKIWAAESHIIMAEGQIDTLNNNINAIKSEKSDYYSICDEISSSQEKYNILIIERDKVKRDIDEKRARLAKNKDNTGSLSTEIAALEIQFTALDDACNKLYASFATSMEDLQSAKTDLEEKVYSSLLILSDVINSHRNALNEVKDLKEHICQYITYHEHTLEMIEKISPKLDNLNKKANKIKGDTSSEDGAISGTVGASLEKQMESIKVDTFEQVQNQLNNNLLKLKYWEQFAINSLEVFNNELDNLKLELEKLQGLSTDVLDESESYGDYSGYGAMTAEIEGLKTSLFDLKEISKMPDVYQLPNYNLEPALNNVEKEDFESWFQSKYKDEKADKTPQKDKTELKKVRKGIAKIAGNAVSEEKEKDKYEGINAEPESIEERFKGIPSVKGISKSNSALEQIGKIVQDAQEGSAVHDNPFEKPAQGLSKVNEEEKNFFDYEMDRMRDFLVIIEQAISNDMESLMQSIYMNEYIVSAFKCETSEKGIERDIGYNRPLDESFFKQAEVEYILFGNKNVEKNVNNTIRSLFATRLLFNLLHVYTSAEKVASALTLATAISGWTIFGVPIVQNLILVAWAGAEAYLDADLLLKGQSIPLVKTASSWQLDSGGLKDKLMEILTVDIKEYLTDKVDDTIEQTSEAIEETVSGIIDAYIDQAFVTIEKPIEQLPGQADETVANDVESFISQIGDNFLNSLSFDNLESFKSSLKIATQGLKNNILGKIKAYSQDRILCFKTKLKEEIRKLIFESSGYRDLEKSLKNLGNDLVNKGIDSVGGQMEDVFGEGEKSGKNNIVARLVMMDYLDYLRLFLFAVPAETKALRTADLIQLNMQQVVQEYNLSIDNYNTFLFIRVELDINTWFVPKSLFKKNKSGMITVEWCQGY